MSPRHDAARRDRRDHRDHRDRHLLLAKVRVSNGIISGLYRKKGRLYKPAPPARSWINWQRWLGVERIHKRPSTIHALALPSPCSFEEMACAVESLATLVPTRPEDTWLVWLIKCLFKVRDEEVLLDEAYVEWIGVPNMNPADAVTVINENVDGHCEDVLSLLTEKAAEGMLNINYVPVVRRAWLVRLIMHLLCLA